jgi:cytosolic carboxypeptidase protein 2/3
VIRRGRVFYTVEFEYEFEYDNDIVWFATTIPYTYSMLLKYIKSIEDNIVIPVKEEEINSKGTSFGDFINPKTTKTHKIWEIKSLGKSLGGLNIPLIEVTNYNCSKEELARRKIVLVWGRVHPGETNASWVTHKIMEYLLSNSQIAKGLRKRLIFHIVPMINPDGVVLGNHRCSILGRDINRRFDHPNSKLEPEPYALRRHLKKIQKEAFESGRFDKILAFIDIHAHSNRKSCFMYGPHYPLHSSNYMKIRVIPKLLSERTAMFRFYSCKFRTEEYKESWARLSLWRDFKIQTSLTIESSFHGYLDENRDTKLFNESNLQYFGQAFCQSLFEYMLILEENKRQKLALAKKLSKKRKFQKRKTIREILGRHDDELSISDKEINEDRDDKSLSKKMRRSYKSKSPDKKTVSKIFESSSSEDLEDNKSMNDK